MMLTWPRTAGRVIVSVWTLAATALTAAPALDYAIELLETFPPSTEVGKWFQPRPVVIPGRAGSSLAVMTIQKAIGSDFYTGLSTSKSTDGGTAW